MDLSIIIPCHNLEKYIYPLLSTLSNQEIHNKQVELLFVCDNCTDETASIIQDWKAKQLSQYKVRIFNRSLGSCGQARNVGLDHAIGKYVQFLDGDDWLLTENCIDLLIDVMEKNNLNILRYRFMSLYHDYNFPDWMMVWQYIFKREAIGDLRFPSIQPDEDVAFMKGFFEKYGSNVHKIDNKLYFYNYLRKDSNMYQTFHCGTIKS